MIVLGYPGSSSQPECEELGDNVGDKATLALPVGCLATRGVLPSVDRDRSTEELVEEVRVGAGGGGWCFEEMGVEFVEEE